MAEQSKPIKIPLGTVETIRGLLAVKPEAKPKARSKKASGAKAKKPKKG